VTKKRLKRLSARRSPAPASSPVHGGIWLVPRRDVNWRVPVLGPVGQEKVGEALRGFAKRFNEKETSILLRELKEYDVDPADVLDLIEKYSPGVPRPLTLRKRGQLKRHVAKAVEAVHTLRWEDYLSGETTLDAEEDLDEEARVFWLLQRRAEGALRKPASRSALQERFCREFDEIVARAIATRPQSRPKWGELARFDRHLAQFIYVVFGGRVTEASLRVRRSRRSALAG